jgi:hypothetical protein
MVYAPCSYQPSLSSWDFDIRPLLSKFSKSAPLFEILSWYCSPKCTFFRVLRLNKSLNVRCLCWSFTYWQDSPKILQPPDSDKYHTRLLWKTGYQICLNDIPCLSLTNQSDRQVHIRSPSLFKNVLIYIQKD